ncbi:MAG: F0F1 ATP synthase subunit delta [Bacteriovoracaceae bacterium]
MKEQIVAKAYAQAIIDLGLESKVDSAGELTHFQEVINTSNALENVLFLEVFTNEEKMNVFDDISKKLKLSPLVNNFINYLIEAKRLNLFPLIYKEVIVLDDNEKGFIRGTVEGAESDIDVTFMNQIKAFLKTKVGKNPELKYIQNTSLTAGFKITVDDFQLDATVDNQLEQFKNSILL